MEIKDVYVIAGAYEENGGIIASCEGVFNNLDEAHDKLQELFDKAEMIGFDDTMDSDVYYINNTLGLADIYYSDGSHQVYEIKQMI